MEFIKLFIFRIIFYKKKIPTSIEINVEGIRGRNYSLWVKNPGRIKKVEGAKLEGGILVISFEGKEERRKIFIWL
jgi:hypothetical protein